MNKAELQKQSAEDVMKVKDLMAELGIRVEARQRLNTENGFIELVPIFISEKRLVPEEAPVATEAPVLISATEAEEPHAG